MVVAPVRGRHPAAPGVRLGGCDRAGARPDARRRRAGRALRCRACDRELAGRRGARRCERHGHDRTGARPAEGAAPGGAPESLRGRYRSALGGRARRAGPRDVAHLRRRGGDGRGNLGSGSVATSSAGGRSRRSGSESSRPAGLRHSRRPAWSDRTTVPDVHVDADGRRASIRVGSSGGADPGPAAGGLPSVADGGPADDRAGRPCGRRRPARLHTGGVERGSGSRPRCRRPAVSRGRRARGRP